MALRLVAKDGKPVASPYIEVPSCPPAWGTIVWVRGLGGGPKEDQHLAILQRRDGNRISVFGLRDRDFYTVSAERIRAAIFSDPDNRKSVLGLLRASLVGRDCADFKASGKKRRIIVNVRLCKDRWDLVLRNPANGREYEAPLFQVELLK